MSSITTTVSGSPSTVMGVAVAFKSKGATPFGVSTWIRHSRTTWPFCRLLSRMAWTAPQVAQCSAVPQPSGPSLARMQATASPGRLASTSAAAAWTVSQRGVVGDHDLPLGIQDHDHVGHGVEGFAQQGHALDGGLLPDELLAGGPGGRGVIGVQLRQRFIWAFHAVPTFHGVASFELDWIVPDRRRQRNIALRPPWGQVDHWRGPRGPARRGSPSAGPLIACHGCVSHVGQALCA